MAKKQQQIGVGIDVGNKNVDVEGNIGRETSVQCNLSAFTGEAVDKSAMDSGEIQRQRLTYQKGALSATPFTVNIGSTAEQESDNPTHDISKERYYANVAREGDAPRPLSQYYGGLLMFGIGEVLRQLATRADNFPQKPEIVLAVGIPQNHYTPRLEADLSPALLGEHTIELHGNGAFTFIISELEVRSQLYYAMVSQYVKINENGRMKRDDSWLSSASGVIDVGSHSFQVARFEPKEGADGSPQIAADDFMCTDDGLWTLVRPLETLINNSQYGEILSLTDWDVVRILETGNHDGVSFQRERTQVIEQKAPQLISHSRKVLGSGDRVKRIVLVGRGQYAFEPFFRTAFSQAMKLTGVQVLMATDDRGNPAPGSAPANGAWKKSLVLRYQPKKDGEAA